MKKLMIIVLCSFSLICAMENKTNYKEQLIKSIEHSDFDFFVGVLNDPKTSLSSDELLELKKLINEKCVQKMRFLFDVFASEETYKIPDDPISAMEKGFKKVIELEFKRFNQADLLAKYHIRFAQNALLTLIMHENKERTQNNERKIMNIIVL